MKLSEIKQMINDVLKREGGYVDHPNDRGGPTNYGITQKTLSDYLGRFATVDDVKNLKTETAEDIYQMNYYFGPKINLLPKQIQPFIFDAAINHGARRAVKFVQSVCNQAKYEIIISVDGLIGPQTRKAAEWTQKELGEIFLTALVEERRLFYKKIVKNSPDQKVFLAGWLNRLKEFENLA